MTKAQIKKELCTLPSKSVVSILMELYDAYPAVKEIVDGILFGCLFGQSRQAEEHDYFLYLP